MKILHINALQIGGAALCAQRICKALIDKGIESKMLVAEGEPHDYIYVAEEDKSQETDFWYSNPFLGKFKHLLMRTPWYWDEEKFKTEFRKAQANTQERPYIHIPYSNYKNIINHPLIEWCDIIHLHWVSGMIDYPSFFKNIKKPIVWTLHDKHPAIGLLHYSSKYFPLPNNYSKIENITKKIKRDSMRSHNDIHLIAISKQMIELCKKSQVLNSFPTTLIHNGVKTEIFKPINEIREKEVKKIYGINNNNLKIFVFSSSFLLENNKGFYRVIEALEQIREYEKILICIGKTEKRLEVQSSFPIIFTNTIKQQEKIAELYSIADFFIQASYEESFGQTVLESMSCGTPVISTPCGIAQEVIKEFNGIICNGFTPNAIAEGIKRAMAYERNIHYNRLNIRQYIKDNFSYDIIAEKYIKLYTSILNIASKI